MEVRLATRSLFAIVILSFLTLTGCGGGGGGSDSAEGTSTDNSNNNPVDIAGNELFTISGKITVSSLSDIDSDTKQFSEQDKNDSFDEAQSLTTPVKLGGFTSAINDRSDYYQLNTEESMTASLSFDNRRSVDLDLYLYDENRNLIDISVTGNGDTESIAISTAQINNSANKIFYIEVVASKGSSNYILDLSSQRWAQYAPQSHHLRLTDEFVPGEIVVKYKTADKDPLTQNQEFHSKGLFVKSTPANDTSPKLIGLEQSYVEKNRFIMSSAGGTVHLKENQIEKLEDIQQQKYATIEIIKILQREGNVDYAEPNFLRTPLLEPKDHHYNRQWYLPMINLPQAWNTSAELGNGSIVAVIDSGVLPQHPDLIGQLVAGYDFVSDLDDSRDGDGIDPDPTDPGINSFDVAYHGTHTSSIIAAKTELFLSSEETGVAGIAWYGKIMPLRALGASGGTSYDTCQAMLYAAGLANDSGTVPERRAQVINMSYGGEGRSQLEEEVTRRVHNAGVLQIAAAGNTGTNTPYYPASFEHVVSVSAVDLNGDLAYYSSTGQYVDITAPGGSLVRDEDHDGFVDGIFSAFGTESDNGIIYSHDYLQGTSMAAPVVAGVAALLFGENEDLTADEFHSLLEQGRLTQDIGTQGRDNNFGWGLIDAKKALSAVDNPELFSPVELRLPSHFEFGPNVDDVDVDVHNRGLDYLELVAEPTSDQSWLTINPKDGKVNDKGIGVYTISVDRVGLGIGTYFGTLTFQSSVNTKSIDVTLLVESLDHSGNIGPIYVSLMDTTTGDYITPRTRATYINGAYQYLVSGVPSGTYQVMASTDNNDDHDVCDSKEACGLYPTRNQPRHTVVNANLSGLDFDVNF